MEADTALFELLSDIYPAASAYLQGWDATGADLDPQAVQGQYRGWVNFNHPSGDLMKFTQGRCVMLFVMLFVMPSVACGWEGCVPATLCRQMGRMHAAVWALAWVAANRSPSGLHLPDPALRPAVLDLTRSPASLAIGTDYRKFTYSLCVAALCSNILPFHNETFSREDNSLTADFATPCSGAQCGFMATLFQASGRRP